MMVIQMVTHLVILKGFHSDFHLLTQVQMVIQMGSRLGFHLGSLMDFQMVTHLVTLKHLG